MRKSSLALTATLIFVAFATIFRLFVPTYEFLHEKYQRIQFKNAPMQPCTVTNGQKCMIWTDGNTSVVFELFEYQDGAFVAVRPYIVHHDSPYWYEEAFVHQIYDSGVRGSNWFAGIQFEVNELPNDSYYISANVPDAYQLAEVPGCFDDVVGAIYTGELFAQPTYQDAISNEPGNINTFIRSSAPRQLWDADNEELILAAGYPFRDVIDVKNVWLSYQNEPEKSKYHFVSHELPQVGQSVYLIWPGINVKVTNCGNEILTYSADISPSFTRP